MNWSMMLALLWAPQSAPPAADPLPPAAVAPEPTDDGLADLQEALDQSVVSTGAKRALPEHLAPGTTLVITADQMRAHGVDSLADAINFFGVGMTVQSPIGPETPAGELGARGVQVPGDGGNHVLVLVDGHAMNEPWGGWQMLDRGLGVPWEMVDHIEMALGPGSVLYGTNAMMAVMNVVTKSPQQFAGLHALARAGGSPPVAANGGLRSPTDGYRWGHDERFSAGFGHDFRWRGRPAGVEIGAEFSNAVSPSLHFGPQPLQWDSGDRTQPAGSWGGVARREVRTYGGLFALELGDFRLSLMGNAHSVADPDSYQADFDDPRNHTLTPTGRFDLRHRRALGRRLLLSSRGFADYQQSRGQLVYSDGSWCYDGAPGCIWHARYDSAWGGLEEQLSVDWLQDGRLTTMVGGDARVRRVSESLAYYDVGSHDLLGTTSKWTKVTGAGSLYAQQMYQPIRQIGFNAGARLDLDQTFRGAHVSPRGAIAVSPWRLTHIKIVYAEAFRAPGIGEVRYQDPPWAIRARGLKPEVVRSLELGLTQQLPGGRGMAQIGGFHSWWRDMIQSGQAGQDDIDAAIADGTLSPDDDPTSVFQYRNSGKMRAWGGFLRFDAHPASRVVVVGGSASITGARREREAAEPLRHMPILPPVIANLHISYTPGGYVPTLALAGIYNSRRSTAEGDDGAFVRPNRAPHDVRGRFSLGGAIPKATGLSYFAWVEGTTADRAPYVVGQVTSSTDPDVGGELAPVPRLAMMFGLRYDSGAITPRRSRPGKRRGR